MTINDAIGNGLKKGLQRKEKRTLKKILLTR